MSFMLDGDICYRAAYARGKDFYPRTDIGEAQRPVAGKHKIVLPIQATLQPHKQLHVRLFPWSLKATDNLYFNIQECILRLQKFNKIAVWQTCICLQSAEK